MINGYPDETFHPYYASPNCYGRITLRITSQSDTLLPCLVPINIGVIF